MSFQWPDAFGWVELPTGICHHSTGYLVTVLWAAVYFYPIRTAIPLTREAFAARMWVRSWR